MVRNNICEAATREGSAVVSSDAKIAALEVQVQNLANNHQDLRQVIAQVALQSEERIQRHEDGCNEVRAEMKKDMREIRGDVTSIRLTMAKWSGVILAGTAAMQFIPKLLDALFK